MNTNELKLRTNIGAIVAEYEAKKSALPAEYQAMRTAINNARSAAHVGIGHGHVNLSFEHYMPPLRDYERHLLNSVWQHTYDSYNLDKLMTPSEKDNFQRSLSQGKVPEFTVDNLMATFGEHMSDPLMAIARGFAEVFSDLDPAYKSHEKVKVGVKGLPKRVILQCVGDYGRGWARLLATINALAVGMQYPLPTHGDIYDLRNGKYTPKTDEDGNHIKSVFDHIELRRFANGNGHLYFDPEALAVINKMLAYYYGETLPDAPPENPVKRASTAVSKDLQYYPTPADVAERMIESHVYGSLKDKTVLDPSCGCGRLLDAARKAGANTSGIEYDARRASQCRAKGHGVYVGNFLELAPPRRDHQKFDVVLMNPPFYGKHYAKHVEHAKKFVKIGGQLVAILPSTARYDHGLIEGGQWSDLGVGAFSESGTNICVSIWSTRIK